MDFRRGGCAFGSAGMTGCNNDFGRRTLVRRTVGVIPAFQWDGLHRKKMFRGNENNHERMSAKYVQTPNEAQTQQKGLYLIPIMEFSAGCTERQDDCCLNGLKEATAGVFRTDCGDDCGVGRRTIG